MSLCFCQSSESSLEGSKAPLDLCKTKHVSNIPQIEPPKVRQSAQIAEVEPIQKAGGPKDIQAFELAPDNCKQRG